MEEEPDGLPPGHPGVPRLQAAFRGLVQRRHYVLLRYFTVKVQAVCRMCAAQWRYDACIFCILYLQRNLRASLLRRKWLNLARQEKEAGAERKRVRSIQALWRGFAARRRLLALVIERARAQEGELMKRSIHGRWRLRVTK